CQYYTTSEVPEAQLPLLADNNRDLYKCGNKFVHPYIKRIRNDSPPTNNNDDEANQVEKFQWLHANLHAMDKLLTNNRDNTYD
uniref:Uncharacterized protein n=1 Tax=Romanomermis culicivorax TaxID=13658 RepID=A0A915HQA6_ROMCU